jgi:carbonic anhydrase/acetyltransferase-like protein (isoleucine patch superfamily)
MEARFDELVSEASFMIIEYRGKRPRIDPSAFIAPTAVLIGDVEVGPESSIWFGAVLRGDNGPISIGSHTSIQDNAVLHVSEDGATIVGDDVTVGHGAVMEDCRIDRYALIGSNATLLNGCSVGEGALIAAGSVVGQGVQIPARVVAAGAPAQVKKSLDGDAASWVERSAGAYVELSRMYMAQTIGLVEDQERLR